MATASGPQWQCNDGRYRTVSYLGNGKWAIRVDSQLGQNITAFKTSHRAYAKSFLVDCMGEDWLKDPKNAPTLASLHLLP
jgi:phosphoribosyl 1,2-cyclic phosphodiesterase